MFEKLFGKKNDEYNPKDISKEYVTNLDSSVKKIKSEKAEKPESFVVSGECNINEESKNTIPSAVSGYIDYPSDRLHISDFKYQAILLKTKHEFTEEIKEYVCEVEPTLDFDYNLRNMKTHKIMVKVGPNIPLYRCQTSFRPVIAITVGKDGKRV